MKASPEFKKENDANQMTTFRPRQIDVERPLPIFTIELESENKIRRSMPTLQTGMDRKEEEEKHLQLVLKQAETSKKKHAIIPTPGVRLVKDYNKNRGKNHHRPPCYITEQGDSGIFPLGLGYDADEKDEEFLENLNSKRNQITIDKFEAIMDTFEREANECKSIDEELPPLHIVERMVSHLTFPELIEKLYNHWETRRKAGDYKDRYLKPPKDKVAKKKNRRNDITNYLKMRQLRVNLERARMILAMVERREKLKRDKIQVMATLFDLQSSKVDNEQKTPKKPKRMPTNQENTAKRKKRKTSHKT